MFAQRAKLAKLVIGTAAVVSLFGGASSAMAGGEQGDLEIHHRLCPIDFNGADIFTGCHDRLVGQSFDFFISDGAGDQSVATNEDTGNAAASIVSGTVEISGGIPGEFASTFVYCSQDGIEVPVTSTATGVSIDAPAGLTVCDWYNTPEDLSGGGSDNGGNGNGGVTTLPNTGVGGLGDSNSTEIAFVVMGAFGLAAGSIAMRKRAA